jgi:hypothetical protein
LLNKSFKKSWKKFKKTNLKEKSGLSILHSPQDLEKTSAIIKKTNIKNFNTKEKIIERIKEEGIGKAEE